MYKTELKIFLASNQTRHYPFLVKGIWNKMTHLAAQE